MEFVKKLFIFLLIFALGSSVGYYYSNESKEQITIGKKSDSPAGIIGSGNKEKARIKLDLLREYTDFVFLPKEEMGDLVKYVDGMGEKVKLINDDALSAKFYATGEAENKEKKILDFLDSLNKSIASDLQ